MTFEEYVAKLAVEGVLIARNFVAADGANKPGWFVMHQPANDIELTTSPDGMEFRVKARPGSYSLAEAAEMIKRLALVTNTAKRLNELLAASPEL